MLRILFDQIYIGLALCTVYLLPLSAAAQLNNPLRQTSITELVRVLIQDILVGVIAPIAVTLALVYTGFKFVTAQGNTTELETARRNFLYVLVGAVLLLGASVLLDVIVNTVNQIRA